MKYEIIIIKIYQRSTYFFKSIFPKSTGDCIDTERKKRFGNCIEYIPHRKIVDTFH